MYNGFDISHKIILITGGTSGIGRAIALGCVEAGAKVVVGSSNPGKVAAMKDELAGHGPEHEAVAVNVADEASVQQAIDTVVKKYGRIDAVVHSAGVIAKAPSLDVDIVDFRRIIDINLTGTFLVNQRAGRAMKAQAPDAHGARGSIVNIASLNSFISLSEVLAYAASKSGVLGLIRGLANEWAQYGIRVNGIAPGVFPTELNRPLIEGTARGQWLRQHTPLDRFGQAEELVGAAIYLLSNAASYTTGETIIVDGGFLARGV